MSSITILSHKNRHEFDDTPSDKCLCNHGIGDTNHFMFLCPFFTIQRATLRQKYNLNNLINKLRLYLYGHMTINFADKIILLSTITFIKDTRRFSVQMFVLLTHSPPPTPPPLFLFRIQAFDVFRNHSSFLVLYIYFCLVLTFFILFA